MRSRDMVSSALFIMIGGYVGIEGYQLGFGSWGEPGSGFLPVISGTIMFLLSGLSLIRTVLVKSNLEPKRPFFSKSDSYKRVILTVIAFGAYTYLLDRAGFMLSTFIFLAFLFRAIDPPSWKLTVVVALAVTILCVLVFQFWLDVPLPEGVLSIYSVKKWVTK